MLNRFSKLCDKNVLPFSYQFTHDTRFVSVTESPHLVLYTKYHRLVRCLQVVLQRVFLSNYARYARNGTGHCRIATWRIKFVFGKLLFAFSDVFPQLKTRVFACFRLGKESLVAS